LPSLSTVLDARFRGIEFYITEVISDELLACVSP
jgi:hypothetical protein